MLRRPVLFMTGLYLGGNRYAIHFEPLADFSDVAPRGRDAAIRLRWRAMPHCWAACRAAPYNWFNFFDFWREGCRLRRDPTHGSALRLCALAWLALLVASFRPGRAA